jgi:hypothetical protein
MEQIMTAVSEAKPAAMAEGAQSGDAIQAAIQQVIQFSSGYIISIALNNVVKLGIPDRLAGGAKTAGALAREVGANEDALYRVLRALASVGLFEEDEMQRFRLTTMSGLLRTDVPGTLAPLVSWFCDPFHFNTYAELRHSLRTGEPAIDKVYGVPLFEYFPRDPELSGVFNQAMTTFSAAVIPAVLDAYDFSGIDVLVDVAGGHGHVLTSILQKYPAMRGLLVDLDHVVAGAAPLIAQQGVTDRCETGAVDFFAKVPAGGDAYIMKHIIHDWNDEKAIVILRNVRAALDGKPDGRLILLEGIVAPANQPDFAKLLDLEMLTLPGGRERTEAEFRALLRQGGFELTRVVPTQSMACVIEGRPI